MTRILLIDDNYHTPERGAFLNRFEYSFLLETGYEVYTLSFPGTKTECYSENDYFIPRVSHRLLEKITKFLGNSHLTDDIRRTLERIRPDLIHCHLLSFCPASVYEAIPGGVPLIQTFHGPNLFCSTSWGCLSDSSPCELGIGLKCFTRGCTGLGQALLYSHLRNRYWSNLAQKVTVFHCPSRQIRNTAIRFGLDRTVHIPPGISDTFFTTERGRPSGPPTAIFAGSLAPCKGVELLIRAMARVRSDVPGAQLLIAGEGPHRSTYEKMILELGLSKTVFLTGRIPQEELKQYYRQADVFVMPSLWQEQFGLVGPEAMSAGLPCIASDIGGISEWLIDGKYGRLVPPGHLESLAKAIVSYMKDREGSYRQGLEALTFAQKTYAPHLYRNRMLDLIDRTLKGANGNA